MYIEKRIILHRCNRLQQLTEMANINKNNTENRKQPQLAEERHDERHEPFRDGAVLKSDHDSLSIWETAKKFKKVRFNVTLSPC